MLHVECRYGRVVGDLLCYKYQTIRTLCPRARTLFHHRRILISYVWHTRHIKIALEILADDGVVRFLSDAAASARVECRQIPPDSSYHPIFGGGTLGNVREYVGVEPGTPHTSRAGTASQEWMWAGRFESSPSQSGPENCRKVTIRVTENDSKIISISFFTTFLLIEFIKIFMKHYLIIFIDRTQRGMSRDSLSSLFYPFVILMCLKSIESIDFIDGPQIFFSCEEILSTYVEMTKVGESKFRITAAEYFSLLSYFSNWLQF